MNANLKKLLQNLFALIILPVLGWYITLGDAVGLLGHNLDCLPDFSHSFIQSMAKG